MNANATTDPRKFPVPPAIPATALLIGWLLGKLWALPLSLPGWTRWIYWPLFVVGPSLATWAVVTFRSHKTVVDPRGKVTTIVSAGPYRFTRNPMYLALMLIYTAGALAIGTVWVAVLVAPVFFVLNNGMIAPEERYLQSAFGELYTDCQRRVRRWI